MEEIVISSIISSIGKYLNSCNVLDCFTAKNRHIDWTDESNDNYGITPDGEKQLRKFISGGGKYQYNFTLNIRKLKQSDAQRLKNAELLEQLQHWCEEQTMKKNLPVLPDGCIATKISAENAMLLEEGTSRNTYQIQFTMLYTKTLEV